MISCDYEFFWCYGVAGGIFFEYLQVFDSLQKLEGLEPIARDRYAVADDIDENIMKEYWNIGTNILH